MWPRLVAPIASGKGAGQTGGQVSVLGQYVGLTANASIDVSGDAGGGTALIGGDFQGKNPDVQNAARTFVGKDVTINADAINSGNGGKCSRRRGMRGTGRRARQGDAGFK